MHKCTYLLKLIFALGILLITACAPQSTIPFVQSTARPDSFEPTITPIPAYDSGPLDPYFLPPYYPDDYFSYIEASRSEGGLVIYSTLPRESFEPVIQAFKDRYPWAGLGVYELESVESFKKYEDDIMSGKRTADIIISSSLNDWYRFDQSNNIEVYESLEDPYLPDWAKPLKGIYTAAIDPMVMIYNTELIISPPGSLDELVNLIRANPNAFEGQIATTDATQSPQAFLTNWFWLNTNIERNWPIMTAIGDTAPQTYQTDKEVVDAVASGQAKIGIFVSTKYILPRIENESNLNWTYIRDGQPIVQHSMALIKGAASPNTARLMIDFILSQEGQLTLDYGGLTPYRDDIKFATENHFDFITESIGINNIIVTSFDTALLLDPSGRTSFTNRWAGVMLPAPEPTPEPTP